MTKKIREATQIIGMLERGDTAAALTDEITHALTALQEQSSQKGKAKGTVTLKLNFSVEGVNVEVDAEIASKLPKAKRARSFYFLTQDGQLSTDHPQQTDMFGPRDTALSA